MQNMLSAKRNYYPGRPPAEKGFGLDRSLKLARPSPIEPTKGTLLKLADITVRGGNGRMIELTDHLEFLLRINNGNGPNQADLKIALFHRLDGYIRNATQQELFDLAKSKAQHISV